MPKPTGASRVRQEERIQKRLGIPYREGKGLCTLTETDIQNEIRKALSEYGIVIRMNTGNFQLADGRRIVCGVKGLSDLLFIGNNGRCAFIEVKSENGKPTPEQLNFIRRVRKLGHLAGIARNVEEAKEIAGV